MKNCDMRYLSKAKTYPNKKMVYTLYDPMSVTNNVIVFRGSTLTCTYLLLHTAQRRKVKAATSSDNNDSSGHEGKCSCMSHTVGVKKSFRIVIVKWSNYDYVPI